MSIALPDYYAILEVPTTATQSDIKSSYRRLARHYHPDLKQHVKPTQTPIGTQDGQDRHIKLLNEAYKVLGNSVRRAAYDEQRRLFREQEALRRQQQLEAQREPKMTWIEGIFGFVRELKKGIRD